ncbi:MAG: Ig-like domain-containing protein, partial [Anaerolineales bacterium]
MLRNTFSPKRLLFIAVGLFLSGAGYPGGGSSGGGFAPHVLLFDPASTPGPGVGAAYIGSADIEAFPPMGLFSIRFYAAMNPQSSAVPLMSFPYAEGSYAWSYQNTVLSFQPGSPLALGETYTFFLDPMLRTADGVSLDSALQWTVRVEDGPAVKSVAPAPGALPSRITEKIILVFDRDMDSARTQQAFSIQPPVRHRLTWRDGRTAEIALLEPLQPDNRYDFIVSGADGAAPAAGADGVVMREDYVLSYWLDPLKATVTTTGTNSVDVKFNYPLDQTATGLPFTITPALDGEWTWKNGSLARYQTSAPIPYGQRYTLAFSGPLADASGQMPPPSGAYAFSAIPPVKIDPPLDGEGESVPVDLPSFRILYDVPVDHASAEAAFDVTPAVGGSFFWMSTGDTEMMEY